MGILGLLRKIELKNESEIFEKHPCRELDVESKMHYLNGIALVMNEDNDVNEAEKKYLGTLVNSFDLNISYIEESISFAEDPDEKTVMDMLKAFSSDEIKYNFIIDCMMVANADGDFCDEEAKLIEHFFDLYDISNSIELLTTLFGNFKAKDAEALTVFFQDNSEMDIGRFLYLFEYLEINIISRNQMDAEDDTTSDKDDVLEFNFIEPRFTTGELDYRCRAITDEPVNNEQFCIFLNEMYQEGNIKIETNGDIVIFSSEEQKEESILTSILYKKITPHNGDLILSCENNEIIFTDNGVFIPIEGKSKSKIVYVTIIGARMFIDWISKYHSSEYVLTRFDGEGKGMFTTRYVVYYGNSFIKHSVNGEFYDSGCSSTYVLDEDNTYKNDILLWSTDGDEDNIEANEEYYSSHTSFRFGKKDQ